jgi:hypothetical protein
VYQGLGRGDDVLPLVERPRPQHPVGITRLGTPRHISMQATSNPSQLIPDPGTVVIFRQILEISWYLPRIRVVPDMIKSCYGLLVDVSLDHIGRGKVRNFTTQRATKAI